MTNQSPSEQPQSEKSPSKLPTKRQWLWVSIGFLVVFVATVVIWPQYWFAMLIFFKGIVKKVVLAVWHKLLQFFLGLTTAQVASLAAKRYVMDNLVSRHLRVFIQPIVEPLKRIWHNLENKLLLLIPTPVIGATFAFWFGIDKVIALILQKGMVIAFFKWLWSLPMMLWGFFNGKLLSPLLQLLAVNWVWGRLENRFPVLKKLFQPLHEGLTRLFGFIEGKIHAPVQKKLDSSGRKVGGHLDNFAVKLEQRKTQKETQSSSVLETLSRDKE